LEDLSDERLDGTLTVAGYRPSLLSEHRRDLGMPLQGGAGAIEPFNEGVV
jgi:hypothetical protein